MVLPRKVALPNKRFLNRSSFGSRRAFTGELVDYLLDLCAKPMTRMPGSALSPGSGAGNATSEVK